MLTIKFKSHIYDMLVQEARKQECSVAVVVTRIVKAHFGE